MALPAYSNPPTCAKCGAQVASTTYCAGSQSADRVPGCTQNGEHQHRHCAGCGYTWLEATVS